MMTRDAAKSREQLEIFSLDQLVPENHLVRKLEHAIKWDFIYELVEEKYSSETGRPSLDPVTLIKLPILQYMFGIRSMRQTVKETEVNNAYRWFLGLELQDPVPHFSTFGKNYTRRFKDTDLFEQIFQRILKECFEAGLVDPSVIFVDSTHVKARANSKKYVDELVEEQAQWYEKELREEIQADRAAHGKKPLKEESAEDDDEQAAEDGGSKGKPNKNTAKKKINRQKKEKHIKKSTSDPESGWFRKGEHKQVFAHGVSAACDRHGIVVGYSAHPGNDNDGKTFPDLYQKLKALEIETIVGDSAYKTPAIARMLKEDRIRLVSTYSRPKGKAGLLKKQEYVYDEYYDCYICPNNQVLNYHTTNREGRREYCSDPAVCAGCPYLAQCTESKSCRKTITRHVWEGYVEEVDENRYTYGLREYYELRKETIERVFAQAKEFHGFRYTQMFGTARMEMKAALTFACINLKKLAKFRWKTGKEPSLRRVSLAYFFILFKNIKKLALGEDPKAGLSTV